MRSLSMLVLILLVIPLPTEAGLFGKLCPPPKAIRSCSGAEVQDVDSEFQSSLRGKGMENGAPFSLTPHFSGVSGEGTVVSKPF